jgi:hypothetical protein
MFEKILHNPSGIQPFAFSAAFVEDLVVFFDHKKAA